MDGVFHEPLAPLNIFSTQTIHQSLLPFLPRYQSSIPANSHLFPGAPSSKPSSNPVCQGGKPAACCCLSSSSPSPSPPYSPACPASLSAISFLPGISFLQLHQAGGGGAGLTTTQIFLPIVPRKKLPTRSRLSRIF